MSVAVTPTIAVPEPGSRESPERAALFGRDREIAACDELLGRASAQGGVLVLRGDPGVGKTALLDAARARAEGRGFRVLTTTGSEAESMFAFAGLQPLLRPTLDHTSELPRHLSDALLSALGMLDAEVPALATVGLAVLELLAGVASAATPLCLVVDDVQWLDASSAEVLRFVSRRLCADPVVLFAAGREGEWPPPGSFPELEVQALGPDAAEALLASRASRLPLSARRRILAQAEGNPLGLVELSSGLTAARRHRPPSPGVLPLSARLEAAFAGRSGSLSEATRAALLVAALAPTAVVAEVLAAATAAMGDPVDLSALDEAVVAGLVDVEGLRIRFRHPLVRSGLIQAAIPSGRRAAHQALAGVLEDPQRRSYHRAEATVGHDAELAAELDRAAGQALRRSSMASAVAALDQASWLTAAGAARGGRLLRAAELSFELGQADETRRFLARTDGSELGRADRARARRLELALDDPDGDDPGPAWELIALAEEAIAAGDHDGALGLLEFASSRTHWGEPGIEARRTIVATARKVPVPQTDPRVIALLAQALPVEAQIELATRLELVDDSSIEDPESQQRLAFAAVIAGDYDRGARLLDRAERKLRKEARLALLARVLTFRGIAARGSGEWQLAEQVLDEADRLAADTAQAGWMVVAHQVRTGSAGLNRDEERSNEITVETAGMHEPTPGSHPLRILNLMQGMSESMLGHPDDALHILNGLFELADRAFDARHCYDALFFLADAAVVVDRAEVVHRAIEVMHASVPVPWPAVLRSAVDYAYAVMADDDDAEARFQAALAGAAAGRAFDRARVQLAYGRWLRRQQQRLGARDQLRAARDTFDDLGNQSFGKLARDELRATGEASPRRYSADWDKLTPQEVQIARLVAEGLSNKQIGERMFLSHRTIASHLYQIFPKLGVSSRTQLAATVRAE